MIECGILELRCLLKKFAGLTAGEKTNYKIVSNRN
jgi:hypothetical protein